MRQPLLFLVLGLSLLPGCASPDGATAAEKVAYTLKVRDEALADLYERDPEARQLVESAPGYVFASCFGLHPGFMTFANGYGLVQNNQTGEQTFIRLTRFALGPGLAVKGYYALATLPDAAAIEACEQGRWYGGAFAEASFRFGDTGGTAAAETVSGQGHTWMWSHTGFAIEVAAGGGKIYPEDELN